MGKTWRKKEIEKKQKLASKETAACLATDDCFLRKKIYILSLILVPKRVTRDSWISVAEAQSYRQQ